MKFIQTLKQMDRARLSIPNGIFGHHRSQAFVKGRMEAIPKDFPHFIRRAKGCRFQDSDGNEYIDYICDFGAMIAGYANPRIEAAARVSFQLNLDHTWYFLSDGLHIRKLHKEICTTPNGPNTGQ